MSPETTGSNLFRTGGGLDLVERAAPLRELLIGHEIGPYRLAAVIGEGGMAVVFRGVRRDGMFSRDVAVKVLKPGAPVTGIAAEAALLADFSHPNIARLFDAGETAQGLEYLVLELVDGAPITAFCRSRRLDTTARVTLLLAVLDALDAAHRNLIAHRDLKPSNILVEADGAPKLLDFGIARTVHENAGADGLMTPEYASPEQLAGRPLTTATDLYSLGVVMRELLADAPGPRHDPRDLDAILARALDADPARRYASANAMRDDLERWLRREPVSARPVGSLARLAKAVRRRPLAWAAAGAVAIALVVLTALVFAQSFALKRSLAEESRARDRAESVNAFLRGVLEQADPWKEPNRDLTLAAALSRAAEQVSLQLKSQPTVEAEVRLLLAGAYSNLSRYDEARVEAQRAHDLLAHAPGADPAAFALASRRLGSALRNLGRAEESRAVLEPAIAHARRTMPGSKDLVDVEDQYGQTLRALGRLDESERVLRGALDEARAIPGADELVAQELNNLGSLLKQRGEALALVPMYEESLLLARRSLGYWHPGTVTVVHNLALTRARLGELDAALKAAREALDTRAQVLGALHPDALVSAAIVAALQHAQGHSEIALAELRALPLDKIDSSARSRSRLAYVLHARADIEADRGELDAARRDSALALEHSDAALGRGDMVTTLIRIQGAQLRARDDAAGAEADLRALIAETTPRHGEGHFAVGTATAALGAVLRQQNRCADAEPVLAAASASLARSVGDSSRAWLEAQLDLAACERARGANDAARARIDAIAKRNPELVRDGAVLAARFAAAR